MARGGGQTPRVPAALGRRLAVTLLVAGMAFYAVEGGEYGTTDLLALKGQVRRAQDDLRRLQRELDSLQRLERALRTDPVVQEKVGRELYGMLRPGEILYQVVPRDSVVTDR